MPVNRVPLTDMPMASPILSWRVPPWSEAGLWRWAYRVSDAVKRRLKVIAGPDILQVLTAGAVFQVEAICP